MLEVLAGGTVDREIWAVALATVSEEQLLEVRGLQRRAHGENSRQPANSAVTT